MSENKEVKPKSFRIDDETADKFKKIASDIGGNQQQTLSKLIESYEFQSGKAVLMDKKEDIEEFENYITVITRKYMDSLEDNQNLSQTIRTEFEAQLKSKDTIIQDLQSQLTTAKQLKEESTSKAKMYADENSRLNSVIESMTNEFNSKMDDMQTMLADKDSLNKALTDSCNSLKAESEGLRDAAEQTAVLQSELDQIRKEHETTMREHSNLEKQLKYEQAEHKKQLQQEKETHEKTVKDLRQHEADALERLKEQSQLALDKAVLKTEQEYQMQLQKLKSDSQAEIDKYQQKYFELLERMNNQSDVAE